MKPLNPNISPDNKKPEEYDYSQWDKRKEHNHDDHFYCKLNKNNLNRLSDHRINKSKNICADVLNDNVEKEGSVDRERE